MKVYGLWWGGPDYAVGYVGDDTEVFTSVKAAIEACEDRKRNLDGTTPGVTEDSIMDVFLYDPRDVFDPYPDFRIEWDGETFTATRT